MCLVYHGIGLKKHIIYKAVSISSVVLTIPIRGKINFVASACSSADMGHRIFGKNLIVAVLIGKSRCAFYADICFVFHVFMITKTKSYTNLVTININTMPIIVSPIVFIELCSACASGKISPSPMYKRNPAKNPRYKSKKLSGK